MSVDNPRGLHVSCLQQLRLCCAQALRLADFYEFALGFRRIAIEHLSGARAQEAFGIGGRVLRITLELGAQRLTLLQFVDQPGRVYPLDANSSELVFQHFAVVVSDMSAAMAQLGRAAGWMPITIGGPQQLPPSSGGVTAFKFRDPEGHPLELLAFAAGNSPSPWQHMRVDGTPFLGIDHSAISVADTARSVAFYEALGWQVSNRSLNDGPAQARLDRLENPQVEVTALRASGNGTPHLELLCYADRGSQSPLQLRANDVAATCLVFGADDLPGQSDSAASSASRGVDPDGHHWSIDRLIS